MACWVWPDTVAGTDTAFSLADLSVADHYFRISVAADRHYFQCDAGTANQNAIGVANSASDQTWSHAAGTAIAANNRYVYSDGSQGGQNTTARTPANIDVTEFGRVTNVAGGYFNGRVFWGAIWDVVLDDSDILRLAQGVEPTLVRRDALVFYSPLMADEDHDRITGTAMTVGATPTVSNSFPETLIRAVPRGRGRSRSRFE
jgi:hypothetical protein